VVYVGLSPLKLLHRPRLSTLKANLRLKLSQRLMLPPPLVRLFMRPRLRPGLFVGLFSLKLHLRLKVSQRPTPPRPSVKLTMRPRLRPKLFVALHLLKMQLRASSPLLKLSLRLSLMPMRIRFIYYDICRS
jgi:hypothetical protein